MYTFSCPQPQYMAALPNFESGRRISQESAVIDFFPFRIGDDDIPIDIRVVCDVWLCDKDNLADCADVR